MNSYLRDMKYAICGILLIVALAVLAAYNLIHPADPVAQPAQLIPVYIKSGNVFSALFTEPFETMVILARDGNLFTFTTKHDWIIAIPPSYIYEHLLKRNVEPKDILIIIHNHLAPGAFSPGDIAFYHYFRNRGFRGVFCIYYPYSRRVLIKEN